MKLSLSLSALTLSSLALVAGCSGNDGAIEVDPAATPLTAQGNDSLFTVRVTEARSDGYDLKGIVVKATPDGKDAITVVCTPTDKNSNSKLDKDESVSCKEGADNAFDATIAGKEVNIELFATIDGKEERVGDGKWTPAK